MNISIEHRFVRLAAGEIHCAMAGERPPVLLLHQTPRSSSLPPGDDSIERWADRRSGNLATGCAPPAAWLASLAEGMGGLLSRYRGGAPRSMTWR